MSGNQYTRASTERTNALRFAELHDQALELGHNMEDGWHDTEPYSWVAQCLDCHAWLMLDPKEDGNGSALEGSCPGAPPRPQAPRRSELQVEAAHGSASNELEDRPTAIVEGWNWS